jgi:hypothetical protein
LRAIRPHASPFSFSSGETPSGRRSVDELYSGSLLLSLLAGTVAFLAALVGRVRRDRNPRWSRLAAWSVRVAWVALAISLATHLGWGHTPGGPQALPMLEFFREHSSFLVAAALPIGAWLISGSPPG